MSLNPHHGATITLDYSEVADDSCPMLRIDFPNKPPTWTARNDLVKLAERVSRDLQALAIGQGKIHTKDKQEWAALIPNGEFDRAWAGERISSYLGRLADQALICGAPMIAEFNGVKWIVNPGDPLDVIRDEYEDQKRIKDEEYRNRPDVIQRGLDDLGKIAAAQAQIDALVGLLPFMEPPEDTVDRVKILLWWKSFEAVNLMGTHFDEVVVLHHFARIGLKPGVHLGVSEDDWKNSFEWIVGQMLDGIKKSGYFPQVAIYFADQWIERWHEA